MSVKCLTISRLKIQAMITPIPWGIFHLSQDSVLLIRGEWMEDEMRWDAIVDSIFMQMARHVLDQRGAVALFC